MTKAQATALAGYIEKFWQSLDLEVETQVVPDEKDGFAVKTNLVNGLPPGTSGDEVARRQRAIIARRIARRFEGVL